MCHSQRVWFLAVQDWAGLRQLRLAVTPLSATHTDHALHNRLEFRDTALSREEGCTGVLRSVHFSVSFAQTPHMNLLQRWSVQAERFFRVHGTVVRRQARCYCA